jgi:hypothetical protein
MKKTRETKNHKKISDNIQNEYNFDYTKARSNRFADRMLETPLIVMIDPEVAEIFNTPEAVNHALRSLIAALPQKANH